MALFKYTMVINMVTDPNQPDLSSIHSGGMTENYWSNNNNPAQAAAVSRLFTKRALLLPYSAQIIGVRVQEYDIAGNKLIPKGSTSDIIKRPGNPAYATDVPQMALMLRINSIDSRNKSNQALRCVPDQIVSRGEYGPDAAWATLLTAFLNELKAGNFGIAGRDLSQGAVQVNALAGGVLNTQGPIPNVAVNDFVRLLRVYDTNKNPVKGVFKVTAIAGTNYTLSPAPGVLVNNPSGLVRKDLIAYSPIGFAKASRIIVKKVGSPFERYRGRRSRVRA